MSQMEHQEERTPKQSAVDEQRHRRREHRTSRTENERQRRRTSQTQHCVSTRNRLGTRTDYRKGERMDTKEDVRRSGDGEGKGEGTNTSEHMQPNGPMATDHISIYGKNVRTLCVPSLCKSRGGNARVCDKLFP